MKSETSYQNSVLATAEYGIWVTALLHHGWHLPNFASGASLVEPNSFAEHLLQV